MMTIFRFFICMMLFVVVSMSAGCSRSPKVNFYTLSAGTAMEVAAHDRAALVVAVGPVTLPELVDRPQLVVHRTATQVNILETHRWAEPLKSAIPRLLVENLARRLQPVQVTGYPQNSGGDADYQVLVDIQNFESKPGINVTIDAFWSVRRKTVDGNLRRGRSLVHEPIEGKSYDALVVAHSRALAVVSRDIAEAVSVEDDNYVKGVDSIKNQEEK